MLSDDGRKGPDPVSQTPRGDVSWDIWRHKESSTVIKEVSRM